MQINRLFEIIYILLEKKGATAKELAERFEVSTRTIYRDVETLSSAGIPIFMNKGKGGGIGLLPDFVLNKTVLTEGEKADILASLKAVDSVNLNETDTAIKKLSSLFGDSHSDWIEVDFTSWVNAKEEKEIFNQMKSAILSKHVVAFSYASGKSEKTSREVEPLKLCFKGNSWYLYGFCKTRGDHRFFKLRRIKESNILEEVFQRSMPGKVLLEDRSFDEEYIPLKLRLMPQMAFRVYDEFSSFEQLEDGSFVVETLFPKGEWLFYYITSFGEHCEVLEPLEARLEMRSKLQSTLNNYL